MEGTMSAADVAAVTNRGYDDGFGGSGLWLFAILALMWGGNGLFGRQDGRCATTEDVNTTSNFARLESQVRANENYIQQAATNLGNGICSLGYENSQNFGALKYDLAVGQANLAQQLQSCCCDSLRAIDSVNYNGAINTAAINANTTAQVQKVLDVIAQNKIDGLQSQINQLQLQNAMCGIVRYPTSTVYSSGTNPFGYGCGCNGNYNI